LITAWHCSSCPSDSTSRWTPCPPEDCRRWLQVRLGCIRLSLSCPFRLHHTFLLLRPARHYPRFRIWHPSSGRQRDLNPPEQRAAQRTIRPSPPSASGRHPHDNVGSATSTRPGSPPITQIPFPACRAHYPGGPVRCLSVSSLPRGLPRITGGSASTTSLSRPAQASLALRPARSQPAQRRAPVPRLRSGQLPDRTAR
jgi:hypothetical protein